ncbi:hypothetical protein VNO80_25927 [Phaseolus coccineus]|uniref:Uncharacterized protein n=1 Tax=Phaseolus coccineus TaxID=3886 RepID=A0AAN9M0D7_PHACN
MANIKLEGRVWPSLVKYKSASYTVFGCHKCSSIKGKFGFLLKGKWLDFLVLDLKVSIVVGGSLLKGSIASPVWHVGGSIGG